MDTYLVRKRFGTQKQHVLRKVCKPWHVRWVLEGPYFDIHGRCCFGCLGVEHDSDIQPILQLEETVLTKHVVRIVNDWVESGAHSSVGIGPRPRT